MTRELAFRRSADAQIEAVYQWYEGQRTGLGDDFLLCLDGVLASIRRNPEAFPVARKAARRVVMGRFPYAVFYKIERDRIVVLSVLHQKRSPSGWPEGG